MEYTKTINVNELNDILRKHYRSKSIYIQEVEVASIMNQFKPKKLHVGIGGVCSITFDASKKIK